MHYCKCRLCKRRMHSKECERNGTTILYSFKNTKNLNMLIISVDRGHYTISQEFHHDDTEIGLPGYEGFFKDTFEVSDFKSLLFASLGRYFHPNP